MTNPEFPPTYTFRNCCVGIDHGGREHVIVVSRPVQVLVENSLEQSERRKRATYFLDG